MRTTSTQRAARGTRFALLTCALILLAATLPALAALVVPADVLAASPLPSPAGASVQPEPLPSPSAEPTPTVAVSCTLSPAVARYAEDVTVSGKVTPALPGETVIVALGGVDVASASVDGEGRFAAVFTAERGGEVVARLQSNGTASAPRELAVKPRVSFSYGTAIPFLKLPFRVTVRPASFSGTLTVTLTHEKKVVYRAKKRVRNGAATFDLPMRGIGTFEVRTVVSSADGLRGRSIGKTLRAKTRRLAVGSRGEHVRGVMSALKQLKIRVPSVGTTLTAACADAVVAFQKAYGLPRTYVFDNDDWRKLAAVKAVKPRYAQPYDHLEVDKRRQMLMVVRGGAVRGLIAVSTGANGNTPEGSFRIQQKHPYTTSGYGGILFRTMGFYGNFAIHGYAPVPPYPASHGCVREPMWVADWVYTRTAIGERLYVYH